MIERYSNPEISKIWELEYKFTIWKEIEILACEYRNKKAEISNEDFLEIRNNAKFDVVEILKIEDKIHHDVLAFLTNLNANIGQASRHVHFGLTSTDIVDTAMCIQMRDSTSILIDKTNLLMEEVKKKAIDYKYTPCIGRSHGIHAEPMTLGLKFALFFEEMNRNLERLNLIKKNISVGKLSGAVGTYSQIEPETEEFVCKKLGLTPEKISTQIISRDRHAEYLSILGIVATSLDRMATEIRLLQRTEGREVEEPFLSGQKGSSAMPHKRNPVICERISGIARVIRANVSVGLQNMVLWQERDISHSSAERIVIPDSIIALDYILDKMSFVIKNLHVYPNSSLKVLDKTRGLIFSQKVLLGLIEKGNLSREEAYSIVQSISMEVWNSDDKKLHLELLKNEKVSKVFSEKEILELFKIDPYLKNVDFIYKKLNLN